MFNQDFDEIGGLIYHVSFHNKLWFTIFQLEISFTTILQKKKKKYINKISIKFSIIPRFEPTHEKTIHVSENKDNVLQNFSSWNLIQLFLSSW